MPQIKSRDFKMYIVGANMRSARLGLDLENESIVKNGKVIFAVDPWLRRIPQFIEPPILRHRNKLGRAPRDLEEYRGYWLVSGKAKEVFESIDSQAFDLSRCDYKLNDGKSGPDLWLCKVTKRLDALDVGSSSFLLKGVGPNGSSVYTPHLGTGKTVLFAERVGSHTIFDLENSPLSVICNAAFKQACKSHDLRNMVFDPVIAKNAT